jgi:hypothetical protein
MSFKHISNTMVRRVNLSARGVSSPDAAAVPRTRDLISLQSEIERCAFFDHSFRPNLSTMSVDDSLHCGEANA